MMLGIETLPSTTCHLALPLGTTFPCFEESPGPFVPEARFPGCLILLALPTLVALFDGLRSMSMLMPSKQFGHRRLPS